MQRIHEIGLKSSIFGEMGLQRFCTKDKLKLMIYGGTKVERSMPKYYNGQYTDTLG